MTVTSTITRKDYTLDGVVLIYPYDFKIFSATDLEVKKLSLAGIETTLTLTTDYSVTGAGTENGGNVVLVSAGTSGETLVIRRNIPLTQLTSFRNQRDFFAERHEEAYDRATMQIQQTAEETVRAVKVPVSFVGDATVVNLIPGYALGINALGTGVECVPNTGADQTALLADQVSATRGAGMVGYGSGVAYPAGTIGDALASIPSAYVTYAADQAQTYRAFTAGGTAPAFTLTPSPAVTALAEPMGFEVKFAANGTAGSNTLNVSGLGAVALKQYDSTGALVDGVVKSGQIAKVHYNGTYWVILNPLPSAGGGNAGYSDFKASCTGASAVITMTAARVTVRNAAGASIELSNVSKTLAMTATGAGGLDTGSRAASTWYYFYFIYNPTTGVSNALASLSANSPTLPSGYTYFRRMGALRTDATANKYPLRMAWSDSNAEYRPYNTGSNLTGFPLIQSGVLGTTGSTPTMTAVSVTDFFPPVSNQIQMLHGNNYGSNNTDQISIESGSDGSLVVSSANGGGKRMLRINYVSSIGVAAEANTLVHAVGWVDNGGPIYVEA